MEPVVVGWIILGSAFVLMFIGVPVFFTFLITGFVGFWILTGSGPAFGVLGLVPYSRAHVYELSVVPLFILMGNLAAAGGISHDIFQSVRLWLGNLRGGLAITSVAAGALFAACCGSSIASATTLGKITIPEMINVGYDRKLSYGSVAAAGTLAVMIPPSTTMVIYGIITDQSIGKLLIAGIFPGLLLATIFVALIFFKVWKNPSLAPLVAGDASWNTRLRSLKNMWGIVILVMLVLGGLYAGFFTPTESGAVGAFGALVLGLAGRRFTWKKLREALLDSSLTAVMLFSIIIGSLVFGYQFGVTRIPTVFTEFLVNSEMPRVFILMGIMFIYIILGFFMDGIAIMFLTLPIIFPAVVALGYDPIWFGIIVVVNMEISFITPPFALNLFALKSVLPDVTMGELGRSIVPFFFMFLLGLALLVVFPQIALFLPGQMT
ncbi:TRAP transporter large permease [Chloroflexota bacterium]